MYQVHSHLKFKQVVKHALFLYKINIITIMKKIKQAKNNIHISRTLSEELGFNIIINV